MKELKGRRQTLGIEQEKFENVSLMTVTVRRLAPWELLMQCK